MSLTRFVPVQKMHIFLEANIGKHCDDSELILPTAYEVEGGYTFFRLSVRQ